MSPTRFVGFFMTDWESIPPNVVKQPITFNETRGFLLMGRHEGLDGIDLYEDLHTGEMISLCEGGGGDKCTGKGGGGSGCGSTGKGGGGARSEPYAKASGASGKGAGLGAVSSQGTGTVSSQSTGNVSSQGTGAVSS